MKKIYAVIALLVVLVIGGVGYNTLQAKGDTKEQQQEIFEGKLKYELKPIQDGKMTIKLINQSEEKLVLNFTSSQKFDFHLFKNDENVYTWSADKMFMAVMSEMILEPSQSETYIVELNELPLESGDYQLEFYSTAQELVNEAKLVESITINN